MSRPAAAKRKQKGPWTTTPTSKNVSGATADAPATFRSTAPDFMRLIVGELGVAEALRDGRMAIEGDEVQLERLFSGRTLNR